MRLYRVAVGLPLAIILATASSSFAGGQQRYRALVDRASQPAEKTACDAAVQKSPNCKTAGDKCFVYTTEDATAYACLSFTEEKKDCWQALNGRQLTVKQRAEVTNYYSDYPYAQCDAPRDMSSAGWCLDDGTLCWNPHRSFVSGLRFIFEPALGTLIQTGDNRLDAGTQTFSGIGVETNVANAWMSLQFQFLLPFAGTFDEQSPVRNFIGTPDGKISTDGKISVDFGIAGGASFIDGILAVGVGVAFIDDRDYLPSATPDQIVKRQTFVYINIQPASSARALIKRIGKK